MENKKYNIYNNIMGWICFIISFIIYLNCIEPSVSWWDCGEFITAAHKLEVGHSPGAPLFLMTARMASLFFPPDKVALSINILSALCSSFTILFLFWSITMLVKKIALSHFKKTKNDTSFYIAIISSGFIGALAFAFSDSFWFSAVEAEVYAMSSLFTAMVFWAILKWERVADEAGANRWLVLIAYLTGLSIGVHLLNLLAIPAIAFVYYFKKYKYSLKGILITSVVSIFILGFIFKGIIPGLVQIASLFELLFVNTFHLPFYSGLLVYLFLMITTVPFLLFYTAKKQKSLLHLVTLSITYIIIGYSTYSMIIIRSIANPPLDEGDPENVFSLLSYLNREQYGHSPLSFGNYYNTPLDKSQPYLDGSPVYAMGNDQYVILDDKKESVPNYDAEYETIFPRMWSIEKNHIEGYKKWADIKEDKKPTMADNLKFFFDYQLNYMYWRYFMWNFAGRQNDIQGHGNILNGNWLSGFSFLDSIRLGDQSMLPESMKNSKAYNKFYFLPLILGLIGFWYHYKNDKFSAWIVLLLFFFTGIAIVLFLNQTPFQPRERDYAYVGSFYAFSIWIGMGVFALFSFMIKKINAMISSIIVPSVCFFSVPALMASEGFDDHDRSHKYIARDFAYNLLTTCEPNAILFTNGDNDTFPLWYLQEVENVRTDVRIICGALLAGNWYVEQMRKKINESESLHFSVSDKKYSQGYYPVKTLTDKKVNMKEIIRFINSDSADTKLMAQSGKQISYFPSKKITIPFFNSGSSENEFNIKKNYLVNVDLFILDLLANNVSKRPVYFASPQIITSLLNIEPYLQQEGLAFRLTDEKSNDANVIVMNTDKMKDNFLNKYSWRSFANDDQYLDPESSKMCNTFRFYFGNLAIELIEKGDKIMAEKVIDKCINTFMEKNAPYNYSMLNIALAYYRINQADKANAIIDSLLKKYNAELIYYKSLSLEKRKSIIEENRIATAVIQQIKTIIKEFHQGKILSDNNS
jgi:hypothetical protein